MSQHHFLSQVEASTCEEQSLILECRGGPRVSITVLTSRLFRVRLAPTGTFAPRRSWAVTTPDERFPEVPFEVIEQANQLVLKPTVPEDDGVTAVSVVIQRDPCRIAFLTPDGQEFCADDEGLQWNTAPAGVYSRWRVGCTKSIAEGEHFFGFGERTGHLDKTGRKLINWTTDPGTKQGPATDPLYIAVPVFMSLRPGLVYGVFFNNTWQSSFDMGHDRPDVWRMEADGGALDYYVFYGDTPAEVNEGIASVCGKMPLPPRWSLGYHQSRWSYAPEEQVRQIAHEFRHRHIPCDCIHLDIAYMDNYRVFTWDPQRFPEPALLLSDLRREGFHTVTIVDPSVKVDPDFAVYREGMERDMFIRRANGEVFEGYMWPDESVFPDFTRPGVRQWWGNLQQELVKQGVSGIWNDMNEPPIFHQPFSKEVDKRTWDTIDLDARQGLHDEQTTHAEVHNLFAYGMVRASYEGLRRHLEDERPFVLTRSGYAGTQRWSACWMGDNCSLWEHLEMGMPQLMNMGVSGLPFVGVDIGGFAGNASGELFARWMQCGVFSPFCRGHTTHFSLDHEPWAFGPEVEAICRTYLQLRYRLLPYLYTLFWEASQRGTPVLRPLLYNYPDDPQTYTLHDQLMLGDALMAAPVYQPGRTRRAVYLPEGTWFNWWTEECISGPNHILARAPLDTMPLYVRGGAIIPTGPTIQYSDEKPLDPLTLDIYPGQGALTLYEDDGHTFAYERGQWCTTSYQLVQGVTTLKLRIGERKGSYAPPARQVVIRVHAMGPQVATAYPDGTYDDYKRVLQVQMEDDGKAHELVFPMG